MEGIPYLSCTVWQAKVRGVSTSLCLCSPTNPQEVEHRFTPMHCDQTTGVFDLYGSDSAGVEYVDLATDSSVMRKVATVVLEIPLLPGVAQRSRDLMLRLKFGRAEICITARDRATGKDVCATAKFAFS